MKLLNIDQRKKYILVVGSALLIMAVSYRIYPVVANIFPTDEEIGALQTQLAGSRYQLEKAKRLKSRIQQSAKMLKGIESRLFSVETPALAAVEIQNILDRIASQNGVEISSIRVIEGGGTQDKRYGYVSVRLTFSSTINQLKRILYAIATSSKYLKVTDASITPRNRNDAQLLNVSMTVAGLMNLTDDMSRKGKDL